MITYLIFINLSFVVSLRNKIECGYKQCPQTRDGALNVHVIPHSHMDAGWVKTFDEYYYGTKTSISTANVQMIYHSVLSELLHDKRRKFTFSETAYFWRWWKEQRGSTRATFRSLVAEGRIQFAGGGWVQADEATSHYLHILDQYTWGLRKINDTLGPCGKPRAGWQIDTYGHSREHASILAQMGYDGLFIGRVDHKQREAMIEEDRMEFMWRGSDVLGKMSDIMTHTLYNLYNAPDGFCFDFLCNDEPIVEDPDSKVYNADKRVNDFISQIERQAKYYDHDNIMVMMGGDFTYQSASNWFMNIDKLINHVNTHPANMSDINIFYSTPSCYLKSIYLYGKRDKAVYTEKSDHFPYGSDANTYWTGFYTSRPSIKYLAVKAHAFLQVVKQLTVLSRMSDFYELHLLRHAVGLILHHDAITGTSQHHVANEFVRLVSEAIDGCTKKVSQFLSILTPSWGGSRRPKTNQQFIVCHQLNISQCRFTETQDSILLLVYNQLSFKTYYHIRLPAIALHYSIRDFNDEEVEYQLVPLPASVINLPGRKSTAIQELCFEAENIPPLGFTAYYISPIRDQLAEGAFIKKQLKADADSEIAPSISNEYIKLTVNEKSGLLESIQHVDGVKILVDQNFYFYSQSQQGLQSGTYSFRPEKTRPTPVTERVTYHTIRGSLIKEIRQRFSDWITQVIRLYRGEEFVELEWIVGPVPIGTDVGKEVVSIIRTNISNNGEFYTDSNGRQMMKRSCWNETASHQKKSISACFYPVTSRICIDSVNSSVGLCVLTDRAQGGTSYNDGEIELMVHRRLLTDDGFGLEETLNEEAFGVGLVVKGRHRIYFGNTQEVDDLSFSERAAYHSRKWLYEPWVFMTPGEKINRRKWQNVRNKRYSALRLHGLPRHISIVTLEPWKGGSILLRLENTLEKQKGLKPDKEISDDLTNSHITVELQKIFLQLKIKMVRETTLGANQWLDEARQMDWSTRYVYAGGDEGILPEDNPDYIHEARHKTDKDYAHYSDEETKIKTANYENEKGRYKNLKYEDYRRKRETPNTTEIEMTKNVTRLKPAKAASIKKSRNRFDRFDITTRRPKYMWNSQKLVQDSLEGFLSRRSKKKSIDYEETPDFNEGYTDVDDGITRSIQEMYYSKPKRKYKPYLRFSEELIRHSRGMKNRDDVWISPEEAAEARRVRGLKMDKKLKRFRYPNSEEFIDFNKKEINMENKRIQKRRTKKSDRNFEIFEGKRRKSNGEDMPFFVAEKVKKDVSFEDDDDKWNKEDQQSGKGINPREFISAKFKVDGSNEEEIPLGLRRKRSMDEDSSEDKREMDYVISLRPTQIRTFIIWFEEKKPFVM
ncbi:unnamed protein product [Pieris macdunnoughi]|uniref:Glycoside hydrolase family 38 central domain-containing protein n=1 Tax=Pieris macdunnoughi TaxID=345717 RepID=A0A821YCI9_9NEOP|nr:unnamed protein product [Pieris macdunnoughi]